MNKQQEWIDRNPILWKALNMLLDAITFMWNWLLVFQLFRWMGII